MSYEAATAECTDCAFQRKEMEKYPSPCKHCLRNKDREDNEGDFFVGEVNY